MVSSVRSSTDSGVTRRLSAISQRRPSPVPRARGPPEGHGRQEPTPLPVAALTALCLSRASEGFMFAVIFRES